VHVGHWYHVNADYSVKCLYNHGMLSHLMHLNSNMSRKRQVQADWITADGDSDDERHSRPSIRIKHTQFNLDISGSTSSQTSFLPAQASPRKKGATSSSTAADDYDSYNWNPDPAPPEITVENYAFLDPEYVHNLDMKEPGPPRRKRTLEVSNPLSTI
jgi:hypothetical protein